MCVHVRFSNIQSQILANEVHFAKVYLLAKIIKVRLVYTQVNTWSLI